MLSTSEAEKIDPVVEVRVTFVGLIQRLVGQREEAMWWRSRLADLSQTLTLHEDLAIAGVSDQRGRMDLLRASLALGLANRGGPNHALHHLYLLVNPCSQCLQL
ncbi:MAG: hypothetical protein O6837_16425 [Deltaproteobacteria bacterium]|nr:hypothetical protein [Deltaproteobacteria bacterium]